MDIVFIINGVCALVDLDVVIDYSTHINLVSLVTSFRRVIVTIATLAKVVSYYD
jgi:hypothetical protein